MAIFKNSNGVIFTTNEEAVINSLKNDPTFVEIKKENVKEKKEELAETEIKVVKNTKKSNKKNK